ncbi:Glutathione S-transferase omega-like 2 [Porphyridium purpureum]|uniref:Glutathione S-transferase omega-like 2 n=1 Tax=Porphyridium purpureum TaxID=35688 RepID=A0A5J4YQL5_PORPP|nr:Glutathione S-transferase omega-like 2 [Porphyridium purpureum]|eukprot:POR4595..scf222_8
MFAFVGVGPCPQELSAGVGGLERAAAAVRTERKQRNISRCSTAGSVLCRKRGVVALFPKFRGTRVICKERSRDEISPRAEDNSARMDANLPSTSADTSSSALDEDRNVSGQNGKTGLKLPLRLGILERGAAFAALVSFARFFWKSIWLIMMNELAPSSAKGEYQRPPSAFRGRISRELGAEFPVPQAAEGTVTGRYMLYVGLSCPWCHRVLLVRALLGMEHLLDVQLLEPSPSGVWRLCNPTSDAAKENERTVRDTYRKFAPSYRGRCTAPLLVDTHTGRIVSNESADIVRMLCELQVLPQQQTAKAVLDQSIKAAPISGISIMWGNRGGGQPADPAHKDSSAGRSTDSGLDELLQRIYSDINNGVYRAGFATTQSAHEEASRSLFSALDAMEARLQATGGPFLLGTQLSEADVFLFPTVFRLDAVYATLFRCATKRICSGNDYPHLWAWARRIYQMPGVPEVSDLEGTRTAYFTSLFPLNPGMIVPVGPFPDFSLPLND